MLSYGSSLFRGDIPTEVDSKSLTAVQALDVLRSGLELPITVNEEVTPEDDADLLIIKGVQGAKEDPRAELVYFIKPNGDLALAWKVKTRVQDTSFTSYVDAGIENGELVGVVDHISRATYQV